MHFFLYGALFISTALFSMEKEPEPKADYVGIGVYHEKIAPFKTVACDQPQYALPYFFKYLTEYSEDATSFASYFIICDILQFLEQQPGIHSQVKKYWDQHKFNIMQGAEMNAADFKKACEQLRNKHLDEKDESAKIKLAASIKEREQQLSYTRLAYEKLQEFDKKFVVTQSQKNIYGNAPTP
jgi:hypothetical protein